MRKIILIILICLITTTLGAGLFFNKKEVKAQEGEIRTGQYTTSKFILDSAEKTASTATPGLPTADLGASLQRMFKSIGDALLLMMKSAGTVAWKNSLKYFTNKIAYDTATHIATGSPGGKPLFITDFKEYFEQTKDEAVGVFFETMSSGKGYCEYNPGKSCRSDSQCQGNSRCIGDWGGLGIDLCEPLDPLVKIKLTVSAKKAFAPKKAKCGWNVIKKNIGDLRNMQFDQLVKFSEHFDPSSNELGAYLTMRTTADALIAKNTKEKNLQALIGEGFEPVVEPISGVIKTPAKITGDALSSVLNAVGIPETTFTGDLVADTIGTFTNTLASKYLERIFKKGFNPQAGQSLLSDIWSTGAQAAAQLFFNELLEPNYNFNVGMNLQELSIQGQGQFNDVIDDKFSKAIEEKCTVGQATNFYSSDNENYRPECANLISSTGYFGFGSEGSEIITMSKDRGLPYRSILVLRKFRIVPVGWELAAEYYQTFEAPKGNAKKLNLKRLIQEYNNIDSAYYGLVDPDWQLKMPQTKCVRMGAGPQKVGMDPYCAISIGEDEVCPNEYLIFPFQRLDYCADYQSCLNDLSDQCDVNDWGYCVEEKPVWNISGTECKKKYFATCKSLSQTENDQTVSYLLNTVSGFDFENEICSSSNKGCREYCTSTDQEINWDCEFDDEESSQYSDGRKINRWLLNSESTECEAENNGCHLFYSDWISKVEDVFEIAENYTGKLDENYLKLAPEYYNCKGYTRLISGFGNREDCETANYFWRTDLNLCVESGNEKCANFVKHCEEKDKNCELYTPVSTKDPAIPAVVENKICPDIDNSDCSDETDLLITWNDECPESCVGYKNYHQMETQFESSSDPDFISSTAITCSQPGCDEFTNLDEVAKGGEGIEYYSYLRQCIKPEESGWETYYTWQGSDTTGYQLKKWELQSDGNHPAVITENFSDSECSDLTDKDCREFFNTDLESFKIYYSNTIVVSEDCHPFRRSGLTEINKCNNSTENFTDGVCIYQAIPKESIKCSSKNNLCREYKSNQGYNYQKIIESYFTNSSDLNNWTGEAEISSESVRRGDYSLKVNGTILHNLTSGDLEQGKIYTLEFLVKGASQVLVRFGDSNSTDNSTINIDADKINEWNFYSLKIPNNNNGLTSEETENDKILIRIVSNQDAFIDNIILKKMQSVLVIKDSWKTPAECERVSGNQNMINCESYKTSKNNYINLRQFSDLCFEDVVGCELVIDSKNSANNISDDEADYIVINSDFKCDKDKKGCTRLGLITPTRDDETVYNFEDKYKIINPDKLSQQVCEENEIFCQEYIYQKDDNTILYYFKDPLNRLCEFKQINGQGEYFWLISGTKMSCSSGSTSNQYVSHCLGGKSTSTANLCYTDNDCTNLAYPEKLGRCVDWVGVCENGSSGCLEYQDPQNPENCNTDLLNFRTGFCENDNNQCIPGYITSSIGCSDFNDVCNLDEVGFCNFYYYKDVEECSSVNPSQGCVGFWQTNNSNKNKRSFKVCENNLSRICEDDTDCLENEGKCVYYNN